MPSSRTHVSFWTILLWLVSNLMGPARTHADGNDVLGAPVDIELASGSDVVVAGTGLRDTATGTITFDIPEQAQIKQVLLYWAGRGTPDTTVDVNGTEVTGKIIGTGSPTGDRTHATIRQDITSLGLVSSGSNSLVIGGQSDWGLYSDGAGVLVIIDDGQQTVRFDFRDGADSTFKSDPTTPQTFSVTPVEFERVIRVFLFISDARLTRDEEITIKVDVSEDTTTLINEARSRDGAKWDTIPLDITVPAGATAITLEVLGNKDSVNWLGAFAIIDCHGQIGDFVWTDTNRNGLQDSGEPGIPDVTVHLRDAADNLLATTTTDDDGKYSFTNRCAGAYRVEVDESTLPAEHSPTLCNVGANDAVDSDCRPAPVTLDSESDTDLSIDFGYQPPCAGSIGDFVWEDSNANGIQEGGETGIEGVLVTLQSADGTQLASTTTGSGGEYSFDGLCAGQYVVDLDTGTIPEGYQATQCGIGTDESTDSNCLPAMVTIPDDDAADRTVDFGFVLPDVVCPGNMELECATEGEVPQKPPGWPPTNVRDPLPCEAELDYDEPTVPGFEVSCVPPPGTLLPIGEHEVVCTVRDDDEVVSECSFTVTVVRGERTFIRGDTNQDSKVDIGDLIATLLYKYYGTYEIRCFDSADADDSGEVDHTDAVFTVNYLFFGVGAPPPPFYDTNCGFDPTKEDRLGCDMYKACQ